MDWLSQALAGGGLIAGFVVAWRLVGVGLQQIIAQQREAQQVTNADAVALRQELTETREALAEAREALAELNTELLSQRIEAGEQRVAKHDALGRVSSYRLERGLIRELAQRHGCQAVLRIMDELDSVRSADDELDDPPKLRSSVAEVFDHERRRAEPPGGDTP